MSELSHLDQLEAEAIYIIREVAASCEKPVMLYSIGKDSSVMLHLALKAFYPEKPPFPFLHVNTTWKFKEMIKFRDETAKKYGLEMIEYINEDGVKQGVNPFDSGAAYTDIIKENIEYEYLLRDNSYQKDVIEEILNLIVETVSVKRKTVRIAGADYPYEAVKGKFLKLDMGHIQYVLDCMDKNTTKVRNIKNYLLTALYNAPNTIGNYYQSEVNYDMKGGF